MNADLQLIDETLSGRSAAFGQLVRKYENRLYNSMVYVAGSREDALDVVQNAFVRAFVKLHTFQPYGAFYPWLYRIAFNEAANNRRQNKRTVSLEYIRDTTGSEPMDTELGPEAQYEEDQHWQEIQWAIAELNDEQRAVLVLRAFEGCRYKAIAEILDLPVSTVRGRLHLARLQLREQLSGMLATDD